MVYCQNCGSENVDDAKFCVNCGTKIKKVRQPEQKLKREAPWRRPAPPQQPRKPAWLSPKSFFSSTVFIVALIVVVAVISFAVGMLMADSFSGGNGGNGSVPAGDTVTMSVQEFFDALHVHVDNESYACYSNVEGADGGDILKVTGKIVQLVGNYDEDIGEYTSIALYYSNESNLLVHVLGNISKKYSQGNYVVITLHMIERYGWYEDLYGTIWQLSGEFMSEEFIEGKFAFELIIPQNQIKEI